MLSKLVLAALISQASARFLQEATEETTEETTEGGEEGGDDSRISCNFDTPDCPDGMRCGRQKSLT